MQDYHALCNLVSKFFAAVDRLDWPQVWSLMAETVRLDYRSLTGQPAELLRPQQITEAWGMMMPNYDAIHHQIGNLIVEVEGDEATVSCHGMASHFIKGTSGSGHQLIVGTYTFRLVRQDKVWRIEEMTFHFKFAAGDHTVGEEAKARSSGVS
ncbi:nuclear transport factor 2 family protein [Pseudovibrio exalbescens]|uniref:nuclear transport factor 2 family protein n=1 Tax=Pseudovibrio exalbescens TaxID=197461 RepID=UPI0023652AFA|nr:nuclear transport factor 2 family protein [Pseudovibrio exalbescens]MDD7911486.1 nuclear transport factor 2 family protein [Pseudovibrio exalbescens]